MRLSRPITIWATTSIHSRGVSPWLMPRSNRSTLSGICPNSGSSASLKISSRATSASRRSTTTPVRSAASMRALRSASRKRVGRASPADPPLSIFCASAIGFTSRPDRPQKSRINLSVTLPSAKSRLFPKAYVPLQKRTRPRHPSKGDEAAPVLGRLLKRSGHHARGLFHDREAHTGLVAVFFRDLAPAIFSLCAALERTLYLGRTFHELVEIHRTELAADHPEIATVLHCQSPFAIARSVRSSTRRQTDQLVWDLSMISAQTPSAFVARENRFPLFRIML